MYHAKNMQDGKTLFDNTDGLQYTGSLLHLFFQSHPLKIKCVFYRVVISLIIVWSYRIMKLENIFCGATGKILLCLGSGHLSRSCLKNKSCFHCKEMHNSGIFNNRNKNDKASEKSET